jgi:hypothetical protein
MKFQRPITKVYEEAAKVAESVHERAKKAIERAKNGEDQLIAKDLAFASKRFMLKAKMASTEVLTLMNDGTLRTYCEKVDKEFQSFLNLMIVYEEDLDRIEST